MKTFVFLSVCAACLALMNVGCSASASVRRADATRAMPGVQVAYTTAPAR